MALFKRRSEDQTVLPEIEKYYEAERHERAGLAWLLALVSVACIALLLIGLFFGGKWVVNRITDDDEPVAVQTAGNSTDIQPDGTINDGGSQNKDEKPAAAAPSTPAPSTPAATPTPTPASTPSSNLPSTGPGSISVVFIGSAFIAWLGHQLMLRRKSSL